MAINSARDLLRVKIGDAFHAGMSEWDVWGILAGARPRHGDTIRDLIARVVGSAARAGDSEVDLLRKLVGSSARPGDSRWDLIRRWCSGPPAPVLPVVTVVATDSTAAEPSSTGAFTFSRTGSTASSLTVHYAVSGTAANGTDYTTLSGTAVILASASSAVVAVTPINDATLEGPETVIVTVSPNAAYAVGSPSVATVTLSDDGELSDAPAVSDLALDGFNFSFTATVHVSYKLQARYDGGAWVDTIQIDEVPAGIYESGTGWTDASPIRSVDFDSRIVATGDGVNYSTNDVVGNVYTVFALPDAPEITDLAVAGLNAGVLNLQFTPTVGGVSVFGLLRQPSGVDSFTPNGGPGFGIEGNLNLNVEDSTVIDVKGEATDDGSFTFNFGRIPTNVLTGIVIIDPLFGVTARDVGGLCFQLNFTLPPGATAAKIWRKLHTSSDWGSPQTVADSGLFDTDAGFSAPEADMSYDFKFQAVDAMDADVSYPAIVMGNWSLPAMVDPGSVVINSDPIFTNATMEATWTALASGTAASLTLVVRGPSGSPDDIFFSSEGLLFSLSSFNIPADGGDELAQDEDYTFEIISVGTEGATNTTGQIPFHTAA